MNAWTSRLSAHLACRDLFTAEQTSTKADSSEFLSRLESSVALQSLSEQSTTRLWQKISTAENRRFVDERALNQFLERAIRTALPREQVNLLDVPGQIQLRFEMI